MTVILACSIPRQRTAWLIADCSIGNRSGAVADKTAMVQDRWAVAVYGCSLLKAAVDQVVYFNDKSNGPVLRSAKELFTEVAEASSLLIPAIAGQLDTMAGDKPYFESILQERSGLAVLDLTSLELWRFGYHRAIDACHGLTKADVCKLPSDRVWVFDASRRDYFGWYSTIDFNNAQASWDETRLQEEFFRRCGPLPPGTKIQSASFFIDHGILRYNSPWFSVKEATAATLGQDYIAVRN